MEAVLDTLFMLSFCLLLTLVIEAPIAAAVSGKRSFLLYSLWCNTATNPLLNFIGLLLMNYLGFAVYACWIGVGEAAVLFAETAMYYYFDSHNTTLRRCFFISLACNGASFLAGLAIGLLSG